jgi:hypothetical protein
MHLLAVFDAVAGGQGRIKSLAGLALDAGCIDVTSALYMYGNGRLFARALRTRSVGYGESGNAVLRDHPSCWRIHAYALPFGDVSLAVEDNGTTTRKA